MKPLYQLLIMICMLNIQNTSFTMVEETSKNSAASILAFKHDARNLNLTDLNYLKKYFSKCSNLCSLFIEAETLSLQHGRALNYHAMAHIQSFFPNSPISNLLKKYNLPIHTNPNRDLFFVDADSHLHRIVLSLFSDTFRVLIKQKEDALLEAARRNGEEPILNYDKQQFDLTVLNEELMALKVEFKEIQKKITPYYDALSN